MMYSKAIEKVEGFLSQNNIFLLRVEGSIHISPDLAELPPGEYLVTDLRVAIPISRHK
ncbi:MAG: hypothetical protein IBX72_00615 [Nitrospirae bacterium]|nr:hypothetical protein [Nitrospirota bacterium]